MADNSQLDAFLAENAAQEAPQAPAEAPSPESPPERARPSAAPTAPATGTSGATGASGAKAKETPEPDDDAEPPAPMLGEAVIPRHALEEERRKRNDWKEKASRAEGENAELRKQLEEAKRAPPPPPVQQQPPPQMQPLPDPQQDPVGFARGLAIQQQQALLNERLNNSEMYLRDKIGDDKVSEYVNEFKQHAERDRTLFDKLYQQVNPYGWMTKEVDRLRLMRDVGDDPAAFRTRIEAEARAKWEQEAAQRGPAVPQAAPVPGMQPSLANARSVASRTAPQWTGEPSLEDVLAPIQNRRNANGQFTRRF